MKAATRLGILVCNCSGVNADSNADLAMGLIISICRKIPQGYFHAKEGNWDREAFLGIELQDKILGIIGFGSIGRRVAKRALGFGMKVIAYSPHLSEEEIRKGEAEPVRNLEELLSKVDILSIHTNLNAETRHMINERTLGLMKKGAYFINTARGEIVDEEALIKAMKDGQIAGAAMDVLSQEPYDPQNALFSLNTIVTPHLGNHTKDNMRKMDETVFDQIRTFFQGGRPVNAKNPEILEKGNR